MGHIGGSYYMSCSRNQDEQTNKITLGIGHWAMGMRQRHAYGRHISPFNAKTISGIDDSAFTRTKAPCCRPVGFFFCLSIFMFSWSLGQMRYLSVLDLVYCIRNSNLFLYYDACPLYSSNLQWNWCFHSSFSLRCWLQRTFSAIMFICPTIVANSRCKLIQCRCAHE